MRAAAKLFGLTLVTLAACGPATEHGPANRAAAPTDIETLPPDESVATPDELANDAAAPANNAIAPEE